MPKLTARDYVVASVPSALCLTRKVKRKKQYRISYIPVTGSPAPTLGYLSPWVASEEEAWAIAFSQLPNSPRKE
jgi:hypothetical protein